MKLTHHVPIQYRSDPVAPEYQAEVDKHTARAEREYQQAQARLAKAELRRDLHLGTKARNAAANKVREYERKLKVLDELVELRRDELRRVDAMMKTYPASQSHIGRGGYRPVPQPGSVV